MTTLETDRAERRRIASAERTARWRKANPERANAAVRAWREKNKDRSKALIAKWYRENKARAKENSARWYSENAQKVIKAAKNWNTENADKVRIYKRNRARALAPDSLERIKSQLRNRIRMATIGRGGRCASTEALVGCTVAELKRHIEAQFSPGMTWENRGDWHIDHIVPCRAFDLSNPDEQRRCFHFSNIRPLWAEENLSKNDGVLVGGVLISARKIA